MHVVMSLGVGIFAMFILCPFVLAAVGYPLFAALGAFSTKFRQVAEHSGNWWRAQRGATHHTARH